MILSACYFIDTNSHGRRACIIRDARKFAWRCGSRFCDRRGKAIFDILSFIIFSWSSLLPAHKVARLLCGYRLMETITREDRRGLLCPRRAVKTGNGNSHPGTALTGSGLMAYMRRQLEIRHFGPSVAVPSLLEDLHTDNT